ncbi:Stk1 family PASTA domain-containing Ser/Thr kinase [Hoyosella sp. G463]|uniref:non-specific serine/threonine protein kinase n=1 Tax=Lolliginicoccus lacisalsi TaxID=2742202 RepID=A0A927JEN9_9ACTN|nr:Stk1 family PASTA domain-containing Ser/Thr kinase [Lolliginicoccus lacisalsi]MBD8506997.1 Stk1 family PASTA domain-containing Ser/Thr kinase [Lolliginicoccus lacisalsi]
MIAPQELSGRYVLGETIGFGGMSEVHRARDLRLQRDVAIKVLRQDLARDPTFYLRFRREAHNAAALNNPTIVAVYDTGIAETDTGPLPYIVMEYVEGETLRDILHNEGPFPAERAMAITADVCTALEFSHASGIIHRDVKPANIMVTGDGAVKVMDFGISRTIADTTNSVTQTATVIGTAQYLSPEQAQGHKVDERSDVYSLGCVFYEILTGQPPFTGDSPVAVAYQQVKEDPIPPSRIEPTVPRVLDSIVLKAMSKNPANRYQTAVEMREDIVAALGGQKPSAPTILTDDELTTIIGAPEQRHDDDEPVSYRRRRRPLRWIAVLVLLLMLGSAALIAPLPDREPVTELVTVPSVVSQSSAEAQRQLRELGFDIYIEPRSDPAVPEGDVIGTSPESGERVDPGSTVALYVSSGPGRVSVPDLSGRTVEEAGGLLDEAGLELASTVEEAPSTLEERDLIVRQNPSSGVSVTVGTTVQVAVGTGPALIRIPDVTGQEITVAEANLRASGFDVRSEEVDSTEPVNTVVGQTPSGGTQATAGTVIALRASNGTRMVMPNLVGLRPADALQTLRSLGWSGSGLGESRQPTLNPAEVGRIISQQLPAGTEIGRQDAIAVDVGELGIPR